MPPVKQRAHEVHQHQVAAHLGHGEVEAPVRLHRGRPCCTSSRMARGVLQALQPGRRHARGSQGDDGAFQRGAGLHQLGRAFAQGRGGAATWLVAGART